MKVRRIALPLLLVATVVASCAWPRSANVAATVEHAFVIKESFARVRKILVRTNAIKKVVAMTNSQLVDQQWLNVSFDLKSLLRDPDWNVGGQGTLTVKTTDPYVGEHEITLNQDVNIRVDQLRVSNRLTEPVSKLRKYDTVMEAIDNRGTSEFRATLTLEVTTTVTPLFRRIAKRRVYEAAEKALRQQEQAIRNIVEEHKDDLIILPKLGSP